MTVDEYDLLVEHGVLTKVELLNGCIWMGEYEYVFGPEQARAARALGVRVHSCVDAVLEDADASAELLARLAQESEDE